MSRRSSTAKLITGQPGASRRDTRQQRPPEGQLNDVAGLYNGIRPARNSYGDTDSLYEIA